MGGLVKAMTWTGRKLRQDRKGWEVDGDGKPVLVTLPSTSPDVARKTRSPFIQSKLSRAWEAHTGKAIRVSGVAPVRRPAPGQ